MKKKYIVIIVCIVLAVMLLRLLLVFSMFCLIFSGADIEINTDIEKYNDYIGNTAYLEYNDKWGMNEEIFPYQIKENMNVIDYKMVYYNPWDSEYLSYLVVDYNREDYIKEIQRLKKYHSTKYKGYYGVEGFDKYTLVAMEADSYNGFVYALTDGKSRVIYVELIFCNYQYDFNYQEYINKDYLPVGFDATSNNKYQKENLN